MSSGSIFHAGERPELFTGRAIFLSASVPSLKSGLAGEARLLNEQFVKTAEYARIRESVSQLCRYAFHHDIQLIFGGHPAISPLVLDAARRFGAPGTQPLVVVFQSEFYRSRIPIESLELGHWQRGVLLWTEDRGTQDASLLEMRTTMLQSPGLLGAVFIGGMDGTVAEADLFERHCPGSPRYAIGSTGSAARHLLDLNPQGFSGRKLSPALLAHELSYPIVIADVIADMLGP